MHCNSQGRLGSVEISLGRKSIPPGGELSVALTRHQVTCGSKPGAGGIFFSCFGPYLFHVICP